MPNELNELAAEQDNPGEAQTAPDTNDLGLDPGAELDFEGVENLMGLDPFAEKPAEPEGGKTEEPEGEDNVPPEGETVPEPGTPKAGSKSTPPAEEEPAQPTVDPEKELLKQQLANMQTTIDSLQQQVTNPKKAEPKGGEKENEIKVPDYAFQIPDQLLGLIDSEDLNDRRQGFAAMAQGVAQSVHKTVMEQAVSLNQNSQADLPKMMTQIVQQYMVAQEVYKDFYRDEYAILNKPELHGLVQNVASQVFKETKAQQWSPELRATIGARVLGILGQNGGKPPATPAKTSAASQSLVTPGTRVTPSAPGDDPNSAQDIGLTVFGH